MSYILDLAKKLNMTKPEPRCELDEERMNDYLRLRGIRRLPDDFLDFLREYNGGELMQTACVNNSDMCFWKILGFGGDDDITKVFGYFGVDGSLDVCYVPIAYDAFGNYFLMSFRYRKEEEGEIYFWNHEIGWERNKNKDKGIDIDASTVADESIKIADSFTEFLEKSQIFPDTSKGDKENL